MRQAEVVRRRGGEEDEEEEEEEDGPGRGGAGARAQQLPGDVVGRCKVDPSLKAPLFQPLNLRVRTLLST